MGSCLGIANVVRYRMSVRRRIPIIMTTLMVSVLIVAHAFYAFSSLLPESYVSLGAFEWLGVQGHFQKELLPGSTNISLKETEAIAVSRERLTDAVGTWDVKALLSDCEELLLSKTNAFNIRRGVVNQSAWGALVELEMTKNNDVQGVVKCKKYKVRPIYFSRFCEILLMKSATVLAGLFLLVITLRACVSLRSCIVICARMNPCMTIRQFLSSSLHSSKKEGLHDKARLESSKHRCRIARSFAVYAFPPSVLLLAGVIWTTKNSYPIADFESTDREDVFGRKLVDSDVLPLTLACLILFFLQCSKSPPTTTALDSANVLFSCIWAWMYCTVNSDYYFYRASLIWAFRTIQLLALCNPQLSLFLQAAVSLTDVASYIRRDVDRKCNYGFHPNHHPAPRTHLEPCGFNPFAYEYQLGFTCTQLLLLVANLAIQRCFESMRASQAYALVEAMRSDRSSLLAHKLLSAMCDAVVHLSNDFIIKEPCPKLASLVLRGGSDMLSHHILDIVAPADKGLFTETLERLADESGGKKTNERLSGTSATALHVSILDMNRTAFPVQVFISCVDGEDENLQYIIGINEDSERKEYCNMPSDSMTIPEFSSVVALSQEEVSLRSWSSYQYDNASDTSESIDSQAFDESVLYDDISVFVDVSSEQLSFLGCSQGFYFLNAPRPLGLGLEEWLDNEHLARLQCNLREPSGSMAISLCPPGSKRRFTVQANYETYSETPGKPQSARIRFSEIELVRKRRNHKLAMKDRVRTVVRVKAFDESLRITERLSYALGEKDLSQPGKQLSDLVVDSLDLRRSLSEQVIKAARGNDTSGNSIYLGSFSMKPPPGMPKSLLPRMRVHFQGIERDDFNRIYATLSLDTRFDTMTDMAKTLVIGKIVL